MTADAARRGGRMAICLLVAALLAGCAAAEAPDADQASAEQAIQLYRDHGWSALDANRHDDAIRYFKQVEQRRPADVDAILGQGEAYLALNDLDQAMSFFLRVDHEAAAKERAQALQGRGLVLLRRGDHAQAAEQLRKAVALDRKLWRAWNGLGRAQDAEHAFAASLIAYRRAIALRPNEAFLHSNLGFSLIVKGDLAGAETALSKALSLDPALDAAKTNLRLALALRGDYDRALAGAGREERAAALNNVGYVALLQGNYELARSFFLQAMEASPTFFDEAKRNLAYLNDVDARKP